jgi:hypothetical protein
MSGLLDETIIALKVLSKLRDYDSNQYRLNVVAGKFVIGRTWTFSSLTRMLTGQKRSRTVEHCKKMFDDSQYILNMNLQSTYLDIPDPSEVTSVQQEKARSIITTVKNLSEEIEKALLGLEALQETYAGDSTICARLDLIRVQGQRMILMIANHVEKVEKLLSQ